jgi:hypothetical protein
VSAMFIDSVYACPMPRDLRESQHRHEETGRKSCAAYVSRTRIKRVARARKF